MKKTVFIIIALIAILLLSSKAYLYYKNNCSDLGKKSNRNITNIQSIKEKMSVSLAIKKMGNPDRIDTTIDKLIVYNYRTIDESEPFVSVYFDTKMTVYRIRKYPYDK